MCGRLHDRLQAIHRRDEREIKYALRFDLGQMWRFLNKPLLDQLDRCADDSARRIILGISEKETA